MRLDSSELPRIVHWDGSWWRARHVSPALQAEWQVHRCVRTGAIGMTGPKREPTSVIVVESGDGQSEKLAGRMREIGINPIRVADLDEACQQLEEPWPLVRVLLLPASLAAERIARALKGLSRAAPQGLRYVSFGEPPDRRWRKRLRAAGVNLALWEPYDDAMLRFQLNRAIGEDSNTSRRDDPRIPTYLLARVSAGDRHKDGIVYSLSEGGAFLETPRPNLEGATVTMELRLPGHALSLQAHVAFVNVPGNLERPNLPHGMGMRFIDTSSEDRKALRNYIKMRLAQLEV